MEKLLIVFFMLCFFGYSEASLIERDILPFDVNTLVVKNIGSPVNTKYEDYGCNISFDYKFLMYVSNRNGSLKNDEGNSHDLWITDVSYENDNYIFSEPRNMSNLNTEFNEGAFCYLDSIIYITFCNRMDGLGSCDIYKLEPDGKRYKLTNLGFPINSRGFESFPSVTRDEKIIYFSYSSLKSSNYSQDIAYSYKNESGIWSIPKLLDFNSDGNEQGPCILSDKSTLIFASDKIQPNFGGYDLYITRFDINEWKWTKPQNLGPKINSKWNEISPSVNLNGNILFFASDRKDIKGYMGGLDIYMVELPVPLLEEK